MIGALAVPGLMRETLIMFLRRLERPSIPTLYGVLSRLGARLTII
jgi:hypothetical protein